MSDPNTNTAEQPEEKEEEEQKTPDQLKEERDSTLARAKEKRDNTIAKHEAGVASLTQEAETQRDKVISEATAQFEEFEQKVNSEAGDDAAKQEAGVELIQRAQDIRDGKIAEARETFTKVVAKARAQCNEACTKEKEKYEDFEEEFLKEYERHILIAEKRQRKLEREARAKAREDKKNRRFQKEQEKREQEEREAKERIERIKNIKPKRKSQQTKAMVKANLPSAVLSTKSSKGVSKNLKKYTGRYCFFCFYHENEKQFADNFEQIAPNYMDNIAWALCPLDSGDFQDSMLLFEFNSTPAVVICFDGKVSGRHRYVLNDTPESREMLENYAKECNQEE